MGFERSHVATLSWSSCIPGFQIEKGIGLHFFTSQTCMGVLFFSKLEGSARLSLSFVGVSVLKNQKKNAKSSFRVKTEPPAYLLFLFFVPSARCSLHVPEIRRWKKMKATQLCALS